jgi:hypothetical protein
MVRNSESSLDFICVGSYYLSLHRPHNLVATDLWSPHEGICLMKFTSAPNLVQFKALAPLPHGEHDLVAQHLEGLGLRIWGLGLRDLDRLRGNRVGKTPREQSLGLRV